MNSNCLSNIATDAFWNTERYIISLEHFKSFVLRIIYCCLNQILCFQNKKLDAKIVTKLKLVKENLIFFQSQGDKGLHVGYKNFFLNSRFIFLKI